MANYERPHTRTQELYIDEVEVTATAAEINNAADASRRVHELTVSGAVNAYAREIELNHASTPVAATFVAPTSALVIIKDTSATGTAAHTLTVSGGTLNGTNTIATLNALNDALVVWFDSAGNGTVVENVGSVALSGP